MEALQIYPQKAETSKRKEQVKIAIPGIRDEVARPAFISSRITRYFLIQPVSRLTAPH
jgi:hypothetical protein